MKTISEVDFAKILLRSTKLSEIEYSDYLERMKGRLELKDHPKGITLEQFKAFHTFLSNIEDFIIAVNMTNVMNQSVDKGVLNIFSNKNIMFNCSVITCKTKYFLEHLAFQCNSFIF